MPRQSLTTVRLPPDLLELAESLVERLQGAPIMAAAGIVNRSTVLRLAIRLGLQELERKHAGQGAVGLAARTRKRTK